MGKWNSQREQNEKHWFHALKKRVCFRSIQRFYRSFRNVLPRYSVRKRTFRFSNAPFENKQNAFSRFTVDVPFEKTNENSRFRFADVYFEKNNTKYSVWKNKHKCAFLFPRCSVHAMSSFAGKWVLRTSGKKRKWESQLVRWTFGFACSRFTVKWDYTVKWEMKHFCLLVRTEMGSHFIE